MEDLIRLHFPNNYGRAWVELLESPTLSEHARICYVAMTSFGKESRAGKEAIRRRMGVKSISTVKVAQKELANAGWIKKAAKGGGAEPTVWDVFSRPHNGQLLMFAPDKIPGRNAPRSGGAPGVGQAVEQPGQAVAPKQEVNHEFNEGKPARPKAAKGKHPDEAEFWKSASADWLAFTGGQPLVWPKVTWFQGRLTEHLERLGGVELLRRWRNHLAKPFGKKGMLTFVYDPDADAVASTKGNPQNARAFNAANSPWKPSEAAPGADPAAGLPALVDRGTPGPRV